MMTLTIELPDMVETILLKQADAQGISTGNYVQRLIERELTSAQQSRPISPFKSGRGIFAQYGSAPSREEIDENRSEMLSHFAEEF